MRATLQSVRVNTGSQDEEGCLVFVDDRLAAVLVRLANGIHGEGLRGKWFLEAGFGPFSSQAQRLFDDIEEAERWCRSKAG